MKINLLDIPVFYINMKQDTEKNKTMLESLNSIGFKKITRIEAIVESPGIVGLSKSQNLALSQIEPPFIIFEDDAFPIHFEPLIEIPDNADAIYLGNSPWAVNSSHHGFYLKYTKVEGHEDLYRIWNMLSSHAILYLTKEYVDICKRTTHYCGHVSKEMPMDVPFAEIQKYYNIYTFNQPFFYQKECDTSMGNGHLWTKNNLNSHVARQKNSLKDLRIYKII